jgi:hypothetical protein
MSVECLPTLNIEPYALVIASVFLSDFLFLGVCACQCAFS